VWQTRVNTFSWTTAIIPASAVNTAEYDFVGVITSPLVHFKVGEVLLLLRRSPTPGIYVGLEKWRNAFGYQWHPATVRVDGDTITQTNDTPGYALRMIDEVWKLTRLTQQVVAPTVEWYFGGVNYHTRDAALAAQSLDLAQYLAEATPRDRVGGTIRCWIPTRNLFRRVLSDAWIDTDAERDYASQITQDSYRAIGLFIERTGLFDRVIIEPRDDGATAPLDGADLAIWVDALAGQWYLKRENDAEPSPIPLDLGQQDRGRKWNHFVSSIAKMHVESKPHPTDIAGAPSSGIPSAPAPSTAKPQVPPRWGGSGFVVSRVGHIVTNAHVIDGARDIRVMTRDLGLVKAHVIAADPRLDIAVIKIDVSFDRCLTLRESAIQAPGVRISVIGFPLSDFLSTEGVITEGIVNALSGVGDDTSRLQIDAALQPGNSGGPVFDETGLVVGVAVSRLDALFALETYGSLPQNVNFAIKHTALRDFLVAHGVPHESGSSVTVRSSDATWTEARGLVLQIKCEGDAPPSEK
jgi:S1-C subfamily serine protease